MNVMTALRLTSMREKKTLLSTQKNAPFTQCTDDRRERIKSK